MVRKGLFIVLTVMIFASSNAIVQAQEAGIVGGACLTDNDVARERFWTGIEIEDGSIMLDGEAFDGTNCLSKMYACDNGSGGTAVVKKWKNCGDCSSSNPDHCTGCCEYFLSAGTKRSLCCTNKCGTTC